MEQPLEFFRKDLDAVELAILVGFERYVATWRPFGGYMAIRGCLVAAGYFLHILPILLIWLKSLLTADLARPCGYHTNYYGEARVQV